MGFWWLSSYIRHALFLFICILRCVRGNVHIRLNEGLGYFQSGFKVDTKGEIITLVLLHPLRQHSLVLQRVFAHILIFLMEQSYNPACCGGWRGRLMAGTGTILGCESCTSPQPASSGLTLLKPCAGSVRGPPSSLCPLHKPTLSPHHIIYPTATQTTPTTLLRTEGHRGLHISFS